MVISELSQSALAAKVEPLPAAEQIQTQNPEMEPEASLQNRASLSKSGYVQSHADGPVAWQLLNDDAVERAKRENKLIFLNIGYKACHYCHLTSVESFSNPECAAILNESFIPIIVDREERPDLDTIYMNYVQAVNGAGGWPLNLFLTPELEPVFGGTYWPGPGAGASSGGEGDDGLDFLIILKKLKKVWLEQEARCRKEAKEVLTKLREFAAEGTLGTRSSVETGVIGSLPNSAATTSAVPQEHPGTGLPAASISSELDLDQLEEAYTHIAGTFDPVYGGFGLAPKFPTPAKLSFLLRLSGFLAPVQDVVGESECTHATEMALFTLRKIRDGGLRDHVGGKGFARYSVTPDWSIPHFEKLTGDNALLLGLFLDAWLSGGSKDKDGEFYDIVIELAEYLTSPPISLPDGGFASSEAADSYYRRGERHMREGAFHLWTRREFDTVIGDTHEAAVAGSYWNVLEDGNVEPDQDPNDEFMNENILRVAVDREELAKQLYVSVAEMNRLVGSAKEKLKAHREKERVAPEVDDKIIAGWNGLIISSLARTGAAIRHIDADRGERYIAAASKAATLLKDKLWDENAKLLYRIYRGGRGDTAGFADDYAFLIEGLLDLYEVTGEEKWAEWADELQNAQTRLFYDSPSVGEAAGQAPSTRSSCGAFYSTTEGAPHTILRLKDGMDTALPSTNAVSVSNLFRLGVMLGDEAYTSLARETINAFEVEILQYPWLFPGLLGGLVSARLGGTTWVRIKADGTDDDELTTTMVRKFFSEPRAGLRNLVTLRSEGDLLARRSPALKELVQTQKPGAYKLDGGEYRPCVESDFV